MRLQTHYMPNRFNYFIAAVIKFLGSAESALLAGFAGLILLGSIILWTPVSQTSGKVSFVDALFTSTSAVCVTGLTVVDTATDYSRVGQTVIICLIQVGGLGIMTFTALAFVLLGKRLSLQSQFLVNDTYFHQYAGSEFRKTIRSIFLFTFAIEGLGAVLLFFFFLPYEFPDPIFHSLFHSISAFCNAGFSTFTLNLMDEKANSGILAIIMLLIIAGGLGYSVIFELWMKIRSFVRPGRLDSGRFSLNTKIVVRVTAALLIFGAIALLVLGLTPNELFVGDKLVGAAFQSVTARTAGFNSIDIGKLPAPSLVILIMLMFIGGSPGSCAGGIKTTSFAVLIGRFMASLRGAKEVNLLNRRIPHEQINRMDLLLGLAVIWNLVGFLILLATQTHLKYTSLDILFEQISAFGTVGLSTGLTADLTTFGKLWLCMTMYVGRLGPLTMALWMFSSGKANIRYPKGTVMIG